MEAAQTAKKATRSRTRSVGLAKNWRPASGQELNGDKLPDAVENIEQALEKVLGEAPTAEVKQSPPQAGTDPTEPMETESIEQTLSDDKPPLLEPAKTQDLVDELQEGRTLPLVTEIKVEPVADEKLESDGEKNLQNRKRKHVKEEEPPVEAQEEKIIQVKVEPKVEHSSDLDEALAIRKGKRARIPNRKYEDIPIRMLSRSFNSSYSDGGNKATEGSSVDMDGHYDEDDMSTTPSTPGSKSSQRIQLSPMDPSKRPKPPDITSPLYLKPFDYGWKRELVYRATLNSTMKTQGDVYYYTPNGRKCRSMREVAQQLKDTDLELESFTFFREPIGLSKDKEIVRSAKWKGSPTGGSSSSGGGSGGAGGAASAEKKSTPKQKPEKQASKTMASPADASPKIAKAGKNVSGFKIKLPETRKIKQKGKSKPDQETEIKIVPPKWIKEAAEKKKMQAAKGDNMPNETLLPDTKRPCSIRCEGVLGLVPTLQCRLCLCLYHSECLGLGSVHEISGYVCKNCRLDNQEINPNASDAAAGPPAAAPPPGPSGLSPASSPQQADDPLGLGGVPQADSGHQVRTLQPDVGAKGSGLVGSMTTWFPPASTIKMPSSSQSQSDPPEGHGSAPKPQTIVTIASRKYLVVPKHNILSVSPAAGAAVCTPAVPDGSVSRPAEQAPPVGYFNGGTAQLEHSAALGRTAYPYPSLEPALAKAARGAASDRAAMSPDLLHHKAPPAKASPRRPSLPSTRSLIEQESRFMQNYLQNLNFGYATLLHVFQYLKVQDLLRAGRVCSLWRDIANHPLLWRTVRMKNSHVGDWEGLAEALKKHATVDLDLRKMLLPGNGDEIWAQFATAIAKVDTLARVELCRCPAFAIEKLAKTNPNLQVINAIAIKCESLDLLNIAGMQSLQELRLKSTSGFSLTPDLSPLKELTNLKHLSLTSVKDLHNLNIEVIASLANLESLDLGECNDFPDNFGSSILLKLTKLEKLRLEKGQGSCCTFNMLEAVSKIPTLDQLELVNFDVKTGFDAALGACTNIRKLLIIPTYISQSATTNHMVLGGVVKLKDTLSHFVWGVTLELLRVTELFVDQCEDGASKDKKKATGNADSIPVLKPVPIMRQDEGRTDDTAKDSPQVEILPLPTLQKLLLSHLPATRVKILKIPFHATWRQSITDAVN